MLRSLKDLERYKVNATDGDIGSVVNFLLDDEGWTVRYLVVKAGGFFGGRQVLVSPVFFRDAEWATERFHLELTRVQVKNSPSVDLDKPVSRQFEDEYYRYYDYPPYWGASEVSGLSAFPPSDASGLARQGETPNVHLRSANEVTGYQIRGRDGAIGHVADFIVDDGTWKVRYLAIDTGHWWAEAKRVLVPPHWATSINWATREVHVDLTREVIQSSPTWDVSSILDREYEARLYDHYGRPVYWDHVDARSPVTSESHPSM